METNEATDARRSRTPLWIGLGAIALALVVIVLTVFQPQKLFIDDEVDEAIPVAVGPTITASPGEAPAVSAPPTTGPVTLRSGMFVSRDHATSGTANVLDVDGTTYLRLESLETDNGPDLYVYLTTNPAGGSEGAFDDDIVDLGRLKGNVGNQNYELPGDIDLARYDTVVIWCDRFDSAFGAADLT